MLNRLNMGIEKCLIIIFMLGMTSAQFSNECTTPNNENGVCIFIHDCPILLTLLDKNFEVSSISTYLKNSFCGSKSGKIKVCCPQVSILPSQTTCGKRNIIVTKIFGGRPSELAEWPWMAALGYTDISSNNPDSPLQWKCGGSLISRRHVLTAAHCVTGFDNNLNLNMVRLGELNLNLTVKDGASPLDVPIELVIPHKEFNNDLITNDIALIKLNYSVIYNEFIQPICLPTTEKMMKMNLETSLLIVAGWGYTGYSLTVLTKKHKKAYDKKIDNKVLCAGTQEGGKDSCDGDSGGPLMWNEKSQIVVMGIVSYGPKQCGQPGTPGIYTRVTSYMDWIVKKVNEN